MLSTTARKFFRGKVVLIIGATGGLGVAAAKAFTAQGAKLIFAGRDPDKLQALGREFSALVFQTDITNPESLVALRGFSRSAFQRVDIVVNLTGADVRKPMEDHSTEEIQRLVATNLTGSIFLTRAFLPLMKLQRGGVILHVGGFADGRLALPFFSVDAATRAGLSAFVESTNRELRLEKNSARLIYFSPSPADTEAERPFHKVWREMGLKIESPSRVADELLNAIIAGRERYIMGVGAGLFAQLNAAFPRLADIVLINRYGAILRKYFGRT